MKRICDFSTADIKDYDDSIKIGLDFYIKNQFTTEGVSLWRLPKRYPVDFHNQSQGIITFATFREYDSSYFDFAQTIAEWTISNMQGIRGNFYYQKYPLIMNKTNYLRWNQGWCMVSLTTLLLAKSKNS